MPPTNPNDLLAIRAELAEDLLDTVRLFITDNEDDCDTRKLAMALADYDRKLFQLTLASYAHNS